jgi:hypothetical protein
MTGRIGGASFLAALDELILKVDPLAKRFHRDISRSRKIVLFRSVFKEARVLQLIRLLNRHIYPTLRPFYDPIPPEAISKMRENYSERLPKTMRCKTVSLVSKRGKAWQIADSLGIIEMLESDKLRNIGERVTGKKLEGNPGLQIICYEPGDFNGPHNDHHPEESHLRNGYVDIHIALSEPNVKSQLLVYEKSPGLLNAVEEVGQGSMILIYQLPFWHYATPLIPRRESLRARRWLLLASFIEDQQKTRTG